MEKPSGGDLRNHEKPQLFPMQQYRLMRPQVYPPKGYRESPSIDPGLAFSPSGRNHLDLIQKITKTLSGQNDPDSGSRYPDLRISGISRALGQISVGTPFHLSWCLMKLKRLFAVTFIVGYLSILSIGFMSHTFGYGTGSHPLMYFIVWDMFCGWNAYANQYRVVAEGESGKYYDVSNSPWGDIYPHGKVERMNYDTFFFNAKKVALNYIRQTEHEPITRLFLIEEYWPKKYDFPDYLWKMRYDEPKERHSYFNKRIEFDTEGNVLREYPGWFQKQGYDAVYSNPRLLTDMRSNRPANMSYFVPAGTSTSSIPVPNGN